jgi:hypothetical protein
MELAEDLHRGDKESRDSICQYWIRCFGEEVGKVHSARFLARARGTHPTEAG